MNQESSVAVAIDDADLLADQKIMKHLTVTIGVMVGIALVIGFVANTIA